jgi:Putative nucleotidyltransferase DUF294
MRIFQRLWTLLAPEELRANSCLVVMGSEGRGEQIVKTDQDAPALQPPPRRREITEQTRDLRMPATAW